MEIHLYIERSQAAKIFRDRAGYANFRVNTIMVGLEGVKSGAATKPKDLAVGWAPKNPASAARLAKGFATDSAMVFIIDAFDTYLRNLANDPSPVQSAELQSRISGDFQTDLSKVKPLTAKDIERLAERLKNPGAEGADLETDIRHFQHTHFGTRKRPSLKSRLDMIIDTYGGVSESYRAAIHLFISWRNRHVHGNATDAISEKTKEHLTSDATHFFEEHSHLDIVRALENYDARQSPSLKELSTLISVTHRVVATLDREILLKADVERLALSAIKTALNDRSSVEKEILGYWGKAANGRAKKLASLLGPYGFSKLGDRDENKMTRSLPPSFFLELSELTRIQAIKALIGGEATDG